MPAGNEPPRDDPNAWAKIARYSEIGFIIPAAVLLGLWAVRQIASGAAVFYGNGLFAPMALFAGVVLAQVAAPGVMLLAHRENLPTGR